MTKQDPEGRKRETNVEIMTKQDPGRRQRVTKLEIMTKQGPVEGRQIKDKPGNHVVIKSVSLQEVRTPSAEAVWGKTEGERSKTRLITIMKMDPCTRNLEFRREQRETSIQINELERMTKQDPIKGRQRETNPEIMTKQDPVEDSRMETKENTGSSQRETKEDKPGNHDETGPNRRETKGDQPGNHDETGSSTKETKGHKPGNHDETDPVEGVVEGRGCHVENFCVFAGIKNPIS